jgi:hypothetical protein
MPLPILSIAVRLALGAALAGHALPALAVELDALPDGMARARLDDIGLYHDPAEWRIEGEAGTWQVHCRGPECDEPLMTIVAVPAALTECSPGAVIDRSALDFPDAWVRTADRAAAIGLDVHVATLDQGCRNWAGSPVYACTVHNGTAYWFLAPGEQCRTSVKESEALRHLLNGLSTAEAAGP